MGVEANTVGVTKCQPIVGVSVRAKLQKQLCAPRPAPTRAYCYVKVMGENVLAVCSRSLSGTVGAEPAAKPTIENYCPDYGADNNIVGGGWTHVATQEQNRQHSSRATC